MRGRGKQPGSKLLGQPRKAAVIIDGEDLLPRFKKLQASGKLSIFLAELTRARQGNELGGLARIALQDAIDYEKAIVDFTLELTESNLKKNRNDDGALNSLKNILRDNNTLDMAQIWNRQMFASLKQQKPLATNKDWWSAFLVSYRMNNMHTEGSILLRAIDDTDCSKTQVQLEKDQEFEDFLVNLLETSPDLTIISQSSLATELLALLPPSSLERLVTPEQSRPTLRQLSRLRQSRSTEFDKTTLTPFAKKLCAHPTTIEAMFTENWIDTLAHSSRIDWQVLPLFQEWAKHPERYAPNTTINTAVYKTIQAMEELNKRLQKYPDCLKNTPQLDTPQKRDRLLMDTIKALTQLPNWKGIHATYFANAAKDISDNPKAIIDLMMSLPTTSPNRRTRLSKIKI